MGNRKLGTISGGLLSPLLLTACLSSGSDSGSGSSGSPGEPLGDFPSVDFAGELDLDGDYDGETGWATISSDTTTATFTTADNNAPQDAQIAVDTAYMLWHVGHTSHSLFHGTVFWLVEYGAIAEQAGVSIDDIDEDGELDDLPWEQGFGFGDKCEGEDGPGEWEYELTDGYQAGRGEFNDICVKNYPTTDGGPITVSGEFEWSEASSGFSTIANIQPDDIPSMVPPEQTVTFSDVTVKWRGEEFTMNGMNRASEDTDPPANVRAVELTHEGSGQTFKLLSELAGDDSAPRHTYQFFHPDLGKFWGLPNQDRIRSEENPFDWVNSEGLFGGGSAPDSCEEGARFGDLSISADGNPLSMVVTLAECDKYNILDGTASDGGGIGSGDHDLEIDELVSDD
ncbi:hypothetical protein [Aquisalimonas sp.]|uniref:hypothetical protein n=1 Tax=Aquisalimonas sp. TaxID=1872621 RepID=UPI0025BE9086|nr:hypothetical protein [Aquisalimonas sp.]